MHKHGRLALLLPLALMAAGCGVPRIKSLEAYTSATQPDAPFAYRPADAHGPVVKGDPYAYGGIASGSGGRDAKMTYGAGAPGLFEGAGDVLGLPTDKSALRTRDQTPIYLVPDPRLQNKREPYLASVYLGKEGEVLDPGPLADQAAATPARAAPQQGAH